MSFEGNLSDLDNAERRALSKLQASLEHWSDPKSEAFVRDCSDPAINSSKRFRSDTAKMLQQINSVRSTLDRS